MDKNDNFALHAVVVKKPTDLKDAQSIADKFIKNVNRHFVRDTKSSFRFRNIPKQKFNKFKTKKINDKISLIFGELKPENHHLKGSGILDYFKAPVNYVSDKVKTIGKYFSPKLDGYNNKSTKTISKYGNMPVLSMQIFRTPLSSKVDMFLNALSFGKLNTIKKKYGFDEFFHLALVCNLGSKNIMCQKNSVVDITEAYKEKENTEVFNVDMMDKTFTINDMLSKTRARLGDKAFFEYDMLSHNCQHFVANLLESEGLYNEDVKKFVYQEISEIIKEIPSFSKYLIRGTTDLDALINKLTGGMHPSYPLYGGSRNTMDKIGRMVGGGKMDRLQYDEMRDNEGVGFIRPNKNDLLHRTALPLNPPRYDDVFPKIAVPYGKLQIPKKGKMKIDDEGPEGGNKGQFFMRALMASKNPKLNKNFEKINRKKFQNAEGKHYFDIKEAKKVSGNAVARTFKDADDKEFHNHLIKKFGLTGKVKELRKLSGGSFHMPSILEGGASGNYDAINKVIKSLKKISGSRELSPKEKEIETMMKEMKKQMIKTKASIRSSNISTAKTKKKLEKTEEEFLRKKNYKGLIPIPPALAEYSSQSYDSGNNKIKKKIQVKNNTLYDKIVKFYEYRTEIKKYTNEIERLEYNYEHKKNIIMREEVIPQATQLIKDEWKENVSKGKAPPKKQRQQTIFDNHTKTFKPRFDAIEEEIGLNQQRLLLKQVQKLDDDLNLDWKIRGILLEHKLEDIDKDNTEQYIENKIKAKEKKNDERNLVQANRFLDEMLRDYKGSNLTLEKLAGIEPIGMLSNIETNGINIRELARNRLQQQQQQQ
jgi:hypothetical protein